MIKGLKIKIILGRLNFIEVIIQTNKVTNIDAIEKNLIDESLLNIALKIGKIVITIIQAHTNKEGINRKSNSAV